MANPNSDNDPTRPADESPSRAPTVAGVAGPSAGGRRHRELADGEEIDAYRVVRLLGSGGMGEVYEAIHVTSQRRVALKLLRATRDSDDDRRRFLREGRLAAQINHPNSVYVFGTEDIDGRRLITMELVAGGNLLEKVEEGGAFSVLRAVDAVLEIVAGLEAAVDQGVLHRDIKPSNCFVDHDGGVKIGDFGLSISTHSRTDARQSPEGSFLGTPAYASPEQVRGESLDLRSDIYSVGATLFFLLTGQPPFRGRSAREILDKVVEEEPDRADRHDVKLPRGLQAVIRKCLTKHRNERYDSYDALRAALLPYSSAGARPADLAPRFGAGALDMALVKLLQVALRPVLGPVPMAVWMALYFAALEGNGIRTPGKRAFGLRVVEASGRPPRRLRGVARAALFAAIVYLPVLIPAGYFSMLIFIDMITFILPAGTVLLTVTMRRSNGFAGPHELLSGTRVLTARQACARTVVAEKPLVGEQAQAVAASDAAALRFGPYETVRRLRTLPDSDLYLARDPVLERQVWIHRLQDDARARPIGAVATVRPGRLRWLTGSRQPGDRWDAYEVPPGSALLTLARERGMPWPALRQMLLSLVAELQAGLEAGDLPERLSPAHVWLDSAAHVRLLAFPLPPLGAATNRADEVAPAQWPELVQSVLREANPLGLGPVPAAEARPLPPLPEHARQALEALRQAPSEASALSVFRERIRSIDDAGAEVRRGAWAAALAITLAGPLLHSLIGGLFILGDPEQRAAIRDLFFTDFVAASRAVESDMSADRGLDAEALGIVLASSVGRLGLWDQDRGPWSDEQRRVLDAAVTAYPVVTRGRLADSRQRLAQRLPRLFDEPRRSSQLVVSIFSLLLITRLAILAPLMLVTGALFRGGPLLSLFGIAVQDRRGARASRLRCLLRKGVVWGPFLLLGVAWVAWGPSLFFPQVSGSTGAPGDAYFFSAVWGPVASVMVVLGALGVLATLARPARGPHDLAAGTRLVRR